MKALLFVEAVYISIMEVECFGSHYSINCDYFVGVSAESPGS